jgi:hypothetical protein
MKAMFEFVVQHQFWAAVGIYWTYSAAVSSMPEPGPDSRGYLWLYRFCHTMAGNITNAFGGRIPGGTTLGLVLIVPLLISLSACAATYPLHPGAVNLTDSSAYDALLIAETAIDQARLDYKAGQLPSNAKAALDALIRAYNVARDSWLTYRGAIAENVPAQAYLNQLTQNLSDLTTAIRSFRGSAASASPIGPSRKLKEAQ